MPHSPDTFTSIAVVGSVGLAAGALRNYGEVPSRLALEYQIVNRTAGTWTPTVEGSNDGVVWRAVFTGTGRTANGQFMDFVPDERLVWTMYRASSDISGGPGVADITAVLRAVVHR